MPPSRARPWLLAALVLSIILVGAQQLWMRRGEPAFPGASRPTDVARIELARGRDQVVLARRADTGTWSVLSAADAPGNTARIDATLAALARMRGEAMAEPPDARGIEPLEVRLSSTEDAVLGHVKLFPGVAVREDDGVAIAIDRFPALPLWQSAWAELEPPRIAADEIVAAHRIGPDGPEPMDAATRNQVATMLERLTAQGFVAAATVPWSGARMVQLTMADGAVVDVQQIPVGDAMFLVRMTSDKRQDVRTAREWAFRTTRPLP